MSELKISDGYEIIKNKILLNNISIEILNTQKEIYTLNFKIIEINKFTATKKQEHIIQLNKIYENQLNEFCEFRDNECKFIIEDINKLDENLEATNILKNINKLEDKLKDLLSKYYQIFNLIPDEKLITNYKLKSKINSSSCSKQYSNLNNFDSDNYYE